MQLPPEIRDYIVHHLSHHTINDWYIWEEDNYGNIISEDIDEAKEKSPMYCEQPDLSDLLRLRLVSREWNITSSTFMRDWFWWPLSFDSKEQLQRSLRCCRTQKDALFRRLRMKDIFDAATFQRVYGPGLLRPGDNTPGAVSQMEDQLLPRADGAPPSFHVDKSSEHIILRELFDSLGQVWAFHVSFPPAFTSFDEPTASLCYDVKAIEEIFSTLQVAFKTNAFQSLVDLRLDLPCTRDVERLADAMTIDAYHRLKHLRIHIMDETGLMGTPGFDADAPSNLQSEFPNEAHEDAVWSFVASCPNLESLGIKATHVLDLGKLCWIKSRRSRGLRYLSLRRISTGISSILELLKASDESQMPLVEVIDFDAVEIYAGSGNWSDLFIYMRQNCPNLINLRVSRLSYFIDHRNFDWEDLTMNAKQILRSASGDDWESLRELKKDLVAKAGGKYPKVCNAESILDEDVEDDLFGELG